MIKSVNQLVTRRCNSKCIMCDIWKYPHHNEMTIDEFDDLYSLPQFKNIEDICISGGEPTLRNDLVEVISSVIRDKSLLKMLFLSTNCSYPKKILKVVERFWNRVPELYVVVSLEGDRETHKRIRGVDSYDLVIETLSYLKRLQIPNIRRIISTTLQGINCNEENIYHLIDVAQKTRSTFTFRIADKSQIFYKNSKFENKLSDKQKKLLLGLTKERIDDLFMVEFYKHFSGSPTIMGSRNNLECLAGEITVFIDCDGTIRPCIYSNQIIGDKGGLYDKFKLLNTSSCPCCTECQVYPRINYGGKNDKDQK